MSERIPSMPIVELGVVSNCWRVPLQRGNSLEELIAEAVRRGLAVIELRQGCLRRFETAEQFPDVDALAELPKRFPSVRFNVALAFPYFDPRRRAADALVTAGVQAARAVAGTYPPHLRLVDLESDCEDLDESGLAEVARHVAALADVLAERAGILSIENSRQPWSLLRDVFARARASSPTASQSLKICYDPCNLHNAKKSVHPDHATAKLSASELSMVHIKQSRQGVAQPVLCDGDVDWQLQLHLLDSIGFRGPRLFEIDSSDRIWDRLDESVRYLPRLIKTGQV